MKVFHSAESSRKCECFTKHTHKNEVTLLIAGVAILKGSPKNLPHPAQISILILRGYKKSSTLGCPDEIQIGHSIHSGVSK